MPDLLIKEGRNTPEIIGNTQQGILSFVGKSFPEDVKDFYDPIIRWVNDVKKHCNELTIESKFYYMASSSVIAFLKILKTAQGLFSHENIKVIWRYEEGDEEIKKLGQDYARLTNLNFKFIEEEEV